MTMASAVLGDEENQRLVEGSPSEKESGEM
jgi:hypothetical protein